MVHIIKKRSRRPEVLLSDAEIVDLLVILNDLDDRALDKELKQAIRGGVIDDEEDEAAVNQLYIIIRGLRRYVRSLEYCLETDQRHALNYTYATWREELTERQRNRYVLTVGSYYVAPLIRKMLAARTVAYSATIGKGDIFEEVTGIKAPVEHLGSEFPHENARVFLPKDTPDLSYNARQRKDRNRNDVNKSLRLIVKACQRFAKAGHRSLVVVVSEKERKNTVLFSEEAGLAAISYGDGIPAKEAATRFRNGEANVLVGTAAQFGQGLDLPDQTAPVIFFLRPGYPSPYDPESQFEERRFRRQVWKHRKWRAMVEALQVRGRNIRSKDDRGVTFFISQQFGAFLYGSLPEWLQEAYCGNKTFNECVEDTLKLLK
jgi:Rad3-related DNA helicase